MPRFDATPLCEGFKFLDRTIPLREGFFIYLMPTPLCEGFIYATIRRNPSS